MWRKSAIGLAAAAALLFCRAATAETLVAASGYRLDYTIHPARGAEHSPALTLIFMHGKNGSNRTRNMTALAEHIAASGVRVLLPRMPWSREWDGTVQDAASALDALIAEAARDGGKVVLGGQSLGATFTLVYRPGDPPAALIGKVMTSPGALLDLIPPSAAFWDRVRPSLDEARRLEAAGKGRERVRIEGVNVSGSQSIEESYDVTPEVYLSFHDPERFPSVRAALTATSLPVFWAVGLRDPVANARRPTFNRLTSVARSRYVELQADHNSAMVDAVPEIVRWLAALPR